MSQKPQLPKLNYAWLLVLAACWGIYFNQLGSWVFIDPGESYYTEAAREMVESGDYIVPHLNYQIYFSKPILTFWLTALGYNLFGLTPLAARLPFALLASALVCFTYYTTKRLVGARPALLAALIAAAAPLMMLVSKTSCIDIAFTAFLNIALFSTALAAFARVKHIWILIWLALALAVLVKGPAALLFFGLASAAFFVLERPKLKDAFRWISACRPLFGIPIFIATVAPWFYLVDKATRGLFLEVFIKYENLARFAGKTNIHKSNVLYYLPVLAYGIAPWFLLLPQALKLSFFSSLNDRWLGGRINFKSTYRPYDAARSLPRADSADDDLPPSEIERLSLYLFSTWSLVLLAFFSLSGTKLDTYVLPVVAPLAVCLGVVVDRLTQPAPGGDATLPAETKEPKKSKKQQSKRAPEEKTAPKEDVLRWDKFWLHCILAVAAALSLAVGAALTWYGFTPVEAHAYDWRIFATAAVVIALSVWQIIAIFSRDWSRAALTTAVSIAAIVAATHPLGFRYYTQKAQNNLVALALDLKGAPEELAVLGPYMPSIMTYTGRPVDTISSVAPFIKVDALPSDGLSWGRSESGKRQFVMADDNHARLFAQRPELKFVEIRRYGDWACYELTNGYLSRPRPLAEVFKILLHSKLPFDSQAAYGPLTVPLGGGDEDWFRARKAK